MCRVRIDQNQEVSSQLDEIIVIIFWPNLLIIIFRLFQNKMSAQKCRLKKELELQRLQLQCEQLKKDNFDLKSKLELSN